MLKTRSALLAFLSAASLSLATPVFAGGGNVWIVADGNSVTNNAGQSIRVVRIYISPELPCKGAEITFKFVEPKSGDFINTGLSNQPYVMQSDRDPAYKNGVMGTTCSTYAKVGSKFVGDREFYATVKTTDGQTTDSQRLVLHMDGKNYGTPTPEDPYWNLTVKNNPSSVPTAKSTYLPKPTSQSKATVEPSSSAVSSDTAQLQQKVDSLQKQLQETQQRQGILEKAFNDLLNRIKSIFPFFK